MPDLLELLSASKHGRLVTPEKSLTWDAMWDLAGAAGGSIKERGGRVACIMENTHEAVAVLVGGLRCGGTVASLPLPHRGQDISRYVERTRNAMYTAGIETLAVSDSVAEMLNAAGVEAVRFSEMLAGENVTDVVSGGKLVQYTSGSTGEPRGIPLTCSQVGANVRAIRDFIECDRSWTVSTWLPLSHDMGLVGTLLTAWAADGVCHLSPPERFARRPLTWLDDMSTSRAMISAGPNFALELVLRALERPSERDWDLSAMRTLIVGGETVQPRTLRRFGEALEKWGFNPDALSPAYGMAEAALAVSLSKPLQPWKVVHVAARSLHEGHVEVSGGVIPGRENREVPDGCVEVAVSGTVLPGWSVDTNADGELLVEGPSVYDGYLGEAPRTEPHHTKDYGVVVGGAVVVLGRQDEVIVTRGRNLHPEDVEAVCADLVRRGCAVAVPDGSGGMAVVAEVPEAVDAEERAKAVRRVVSQGVGVAPSVVVFVKRGSIEKTPSGKLRRRAVGARLVAGTLEVLSRHAFRE